MELLCNSGIKTLLPLIKISKLGGGLSVPGPSENLFSCCYSWTVTVGGFSCKARFVSFILGRFMHAYGLWLSLFHSLFFVQVSLSLFSLFFSFFFSFFLSLSSSSAASLTLTTKKKKLEQTTWKPRFIFELLIFKSASLSVSVYCTSETIRKTSLDPLHSNLAPEFRNKQALTCSPLIYVVKLLVYARRWG